MGQRVVDDARRLGGGIVLLYKGTGNVHQCHVVIVDVVELQTYLGHFISGLAQISLYKLTIININTRRVSEALISST